VHIALALRTRGRGRYECEYDPDLQMLPMICSVLKSKLLDNFGTHEILLVGINILQQADEACSSRLSKAYSRLIEACIRLIKPVAIGLWRPKALGLKGL
jgi:hypothetical protein